MADFYRKTPGQPWHHAVRRCLHWRIAGQGIFPGSFKGLVAFSGAQQAMVDVGCVLVRECAGVSTWRSLTRGADR